MPFIQVSKRLILPKPSNRPRETAGKGEPTYPVHSVPTSSSLVSSLMALAARRKTIWALIAGNTLVSVV